MELVIGLLVVAAGFGIIGYSIAKIEAPRKNLEAGDEIPALPSATSTGADHKFVPNNPSCFPYRTAGLLDEPPAAKPISFENFIRYCQANGIPDEPKDDIEFWNIVQRVDLNAEKLVKFFARTIKVAGLRGATTLVPEFENAAFFVPALYVVASRGRQEDADILLRLMNHKYYTVKYFALQAMGRVWPVQLATIATVCDYLDFRHTEIALEELIQAAARTTLVSWRNADPKVYKELTRSLLFYH